MWFKGENENAVFFKKTGIVIFLTKNIDFLSTKNYTIII